MSEANELLAEYAKTGSETAFQEVVRRYLDLVYSTAVRLMNGDTHAAEDVSQRVFADVARMAGTLARDVTLGGWLHRHTCFTAGKAMRAERRRRAREQQAVEMNEIDDHAAAHLGAIAPVLDEAINQLGSEDRQAIVLRYFEQQDFRAVGSALGSNEDAARKRVNRAVEKLRNLLQRRGVTLSAAALGTALGGGAVTAAPVGLAGVVSASALLTAAAGGGTALTFLHIIAMTKVQGGIVAAVTLALAIPLAVQSRTQTKLREENQALRAQAQQVEILNTENTRLSNLLAKASRPAATPPKKEEFSELMKLRGEVGTLRKTANEAEAVTKAASSSPLSGLTANPEMSKMIREQQKMGLGMVYQGLAKQASLPPEKMEQLNNLMADNVMTNIQHITDVLREGKAAHEMEALFAQQEADLKGKVKNLLGDEGFAKYEDYTHKIASYLTSQQFKGMMTGDQEAKESRAKQMFELMQEETARALSSAGLPADYQTVPTLNFRNIASEQEGEKNLALLDAIYEQVQSRAGSFLSPDEVTKFGEFRKMAINNNRMALAVNRKLMAPAVSKPGQE